ncbi:Coenzyme Q (ubiquinone) biosynthesis protein Coq4 [Maribacter aquivivus]|uniref:Coenzyme Q (Ubiquinone) biosynthesis protein Coq4 n=1 Tax=Maribacter aquivivus TaxID=228958 RepID=A0A1M6MDH5_9FLAO|nr:Coq4 family protein [Maribacter aquivivus]SHJ81514.1 Coenzyme Q (ubiquinone) biosynthesis protein Coq4 [Maribacter aquivivus]
MRAAILEKLYDWSVTPYQYFKKNEAWQYNAEELKEYHSNSLGYHMGEFLVANNFQLQDKLESHDVFHVLTNTGTTVPEEISMQFYLMGNGKRSFYLFTVILIGSMLYPEYWKFFISKYTCGKSALPFHQLEFQKLLNQPIQRIKSTFLIP